MTTLFLVTSCCCIGLSQQNSGVSQSAWYVYQGDHPVNNTCGLHLEGKLGRSPLIANAQQLLVPPGIDLKVDSKMSATFGYAFVRNSPPSGSTDVLGPEPRHTIFEQLNREDHALGLKLVNSLRFEQTFAGSRRGRPNLEWSLRQRARYRLSLDVPVPKTQHGIFPGYYAVYNELAISILPEGQRTVLNQNRTYGAAEKTELEVGYLYQYRPISNGIVAEENHSLQITIHSRRRLKDLLEPYRDASTKRLPTADNPSKRFF